MLLTRAAHETAAAQAMTPYRVDCRDVARVATILFHRFVRANPDKFKSGAAPKLRASHEEALDLAVFTGAIKSAVESGARIPEAWFNNQLGVPEPKPGERLLGDPIPGRAPAPPKQLPPGAAKPADPNAPPEGTAA
jgi:phage gp29-like protein